MSYLGEVLKGIVDDGIPIKGTFAWSLVDNFEWNSGFSSESIGWFTNSHGREGRRERGEQTVADELL